jgi:quercetin dioxygenase-like cupin family protein
MYVKNWSEIPEVEVLPNNYRKSIAGLKSGLNLIRWEHPASSPLHKHADSEQMIIMIEGEITMNIEDREYLMRKGDIAVIPIDTLHSGQTTGQNAIFYEIFSPLRVQNLIGFIGKVF